MVAIQTSAITQLDDLGIYSTWDSRIITDSRDNECGGGK